jgi:hypothetical protein
MGEAAIAEDEHQDGEPDEAAIQGWLVDHYSHVAKLTQPRIRVLLGLRDKYPYLRAPAVLSIYRGLSNVSPGIAGKLVGESDPAVDKSWTTSLEQASKFASGEYIKPGDIDEETVGAVMHAKVDPEQLLLDADAIALLDAVGSAIHPIWKIPIRQSIVDEREVVVLGPVEVERVEVVPMRTRQDYDANTICVVLPVPQQIAAAFPEDAERGCPHVTMLYIGAGSEFEFETVVRLTGEALALLAGEQVELGEPSHGPLGNGEQQVIYVDAKVSDEVKGVRDALAESVRRPASKRSTATGLGCRTRRSRIASSAPSSKVRCRRGPGRSTRSRFGAGTLTRSCLRVPSNSEQTHRRPSELRPSTRCRAT